MPTQNLLPHDGTVHYPGKILSKARADAFYEALRTEIAWKPDEIQLFGKRIQTKREVAWYADEPFSYTYSRTTKHALAWTKTLLELKTIVEKASGEHFNSCLLNLYHDGTQGMAWHADSEAMLKPQGTIASLSLGAERRFLFRHKTTNEIVETFLEHGSLLLMKGQTQSFWQHRLPPSAKITSARINLTFRNINPPTKS